MRRALVGGFNASNHLNASSMGFAFVGGESTEKGAERSGGERAVQKPPPVARAVYRRGSSVVLNDGHGGLPRGVYLRGPPHVLNAGDGGVVPSTLLRAISSPSRLLPRASGAWLPELRLRARFSGPSGHYPAIAVLGACTKSALARVCVYGFVRVRV